jgi:hypothetical protein
MSKITLYDSQVYSNANRLSSPQSFTLSPGVIRPMMVVFVNVVGSGVSWSSASWAGESMTREDSISSLDMWYISDPKRGTNDLTFTWNAGNAASDSIIQLYVFENVYGWRSGSTGTQSSTGAKTSVSGSVGDMLVWACDNDAVFDPLSGFTFEETDLGDVDIFSAYGEAQTSPDDIGYDSASGSPTINKIYGALRPAVPRRACVMI